MIVQPAKDMNLCFFIFLIKLVNAFIDQNPSFLADMNAVFEEVFCVFLVGKVC